VAEDQPHPYPKAVILHAALALLVFAGIWVIGLLAYWGAGIPWSWRTVLVLVATLVTAICGVLMLTTRPLQAHVAAGLTVMALSLLRVGDPYDWGWASWFILVSTLVLTMPLIRALLVMQQFDRMHGA